MASYKLVPTYVNTEKFRLSGIRQEVAGIEQRIQSLVSMLPDAGAAPVLRTVIGEMERMIQVIEVDVKKFLDADNREVLITLAEKLRKYKKDFEKFLSIGTQFAGIAVLMSGTVSFSRVAAFPRSKVYSYRSKSWLHKVNGRYPNVIARSIDKFLRVEPRNFVTKYFHSKLGLNKGFTNPANYVKGHLLGLPKNSNFAGVKKIASSVSKRFGAINVLSTSIGEGYGLLKKVNKGEATTADYVTTGTNIAIKSGATYAGAAVGATTLSFLGPPGIIVGGMVGGYVGGKVGDFVAKQVENVVRNFDKVKEEGAKIIHDIGEKGKEIFNKGKKWVTGWFK
ncbi:hypothetical protein [Aneurinibacillus aneurinilyticus]|nr:hypothetical protein [Aneurinibacillus aneurinilyticus]MCI1696708.1 hypothetical protein [Aneurinibacillus aneurinilyticus]MED0673408.1 hypothetical protein [Aneurinibacillus aneurinilyticus]MED0709511.1 hypothetical protein [Aneurinibacillus aneurinilyticus]MED0725141.1 hypothetical protein [Aneurinibacillus aneurinilyticus]MED0733983.1 hypothetical protein [Aneurinibacillus aneurinilyticus]